MKTDPSVARLRFDGFELDEAEARLTCAGQPVALAPKPFAVLCALARTPGSLVTKNALLDAVWGHRFVTDSVLKSAISEVRAALGDDPKQPRYIETVSRRGYRFIAARSARPRNARLPSSGTSRRARPSGAGGAHGIVPRRRGARRPHPRGRRHAGARAACPQRFLAESASHETLRATPKRSASPADRGDRCPPRGRTFPAPADAVRLLAAAGPRGGRAVSLHLAGLHRGPDLYDEVMQSLVDLAEELPEAVQLMRGRTFARAVH